MFESTPVNETTDAKEATVSTKHPYLRFWIGAAALLHLVGAITVAIITAHTDQVVPLSRGYVVWPKMDSGQKFRFGNQPSGTISMKGLVIAFFLLSFVFQGITVLPFFGLWDRYIMSLKKELHNVFRWVEYSFSASCLFVLGALVNGTVDLYHILLIFSGMWTVMMLGLVQEAVANYLLKISSNKISTPTWYEFFMPHAIGWVLYAFLWAEQLDRFKSAIDRAENSKPPEWVYGLYVVQVVLFSSFGFNQLAEMIRLYKRLQITKPQYDDENAKIAIQHECIYVFLSLVAKTICAYFLTSGMLASSKSGTY